MKVNYKLEVEGSKVGELINALTLVPKDAVVHVESVERALIITWEVVGKDNVLPFHPHGSGLRSV